MHVRTYIYIHKKVSYKLGHQYSVSLKYNNKRRYYRTKQRDSLKDIQETFVSNHIGRTCTFHYCLKRHEKHSKIHLKIFLELSFYYI